MNNSIYKKISSTAFAALAVSVSVAHDAFANTAKQEILSGAGATGQTGGTTVEGSIETITNVLLFLIGAISVLAIILGAFRYVTSNGDTGQIKTAKDTIMYAVVGLIVAIMAFAIVQFVLKQFN